MSGRNLKEKEVKRKLWVKVLCIVLCVLMVGGTVATALVMLLA